MNGAIAPWQRWAMLHLGHFARIGEQVIEVGVPARRVVTITLRLHFGPVEKRPLRPGPTPFLPLDCTGFRQREGGEPSLPDLGGLALVI